MIFCAKCKKQLVCVKNGVTLTWCHVNRRQGDLYRCPKCEHQIITGLSEPYHATGPVDPKWSIEMEGSNG
jgi:DNA-directed RNA polymerase subunit RPC12/RpoP